MRPIAIFLATALAIGLTAEVHGASQSCKEAATVKVTAITEAEYEAGVKDAGPSACVTEDGITICQITPTASDDGWQVVAEVPSDANWQESEVSLSVLSGETCWFGWTSNWLWTESPRIQALTSFQIPESPPLLEFRAFVDIGGRYTETACPFGDGHDGRTCQDTEK